MTQRLRRRSTGHTRGGAGALLRLGLALWLVGYLVYTPIHVCSAPHNEGGASRIGPVGADARGVVRASGEPGEPHHPEHPARDHQCKAAPPGVTAAADARPVPVLEWTEAAIDPPLARTFGFSGLSPPELVRSWQFLFRAALPVRAPASLA